ncbi:uncharacterized protein LOC116294676 [Actinia tenebrosa]|uniref:Uncharacterized protein LOC116294676 n=1 Tax=Actinia tenebrosa TaxID=6105 RepID=A0A6P8HZZ6_ACTTE|nr:uncharacterized protein LOC116294676 [Actinia tenebrosa]
MDGARILLFFSLAIMSADQITREGLPALTNGHPGTNRGYGIMGTTDEEDSEKWAKEQDKAFKKLEKNWFQRRFSGGGSGSGAEESGSGSNSNKRKKPIQMLISRLRSSDIKLGHKRQMGYDVQSYSNTDANRIIKQAVNETIQENTTEPPPMPPTMPKTTSPVEPYTYLPPNITVPPSKVTVNEVSETTTVQGSGTASSSVNVKGVGGQEMSIKTSQKGPNGDGANNTYSANGPKPGMPVSLHVGNNLSSIDIVDMKTTPSKAINQPSSYGYYPEYSDAQVQEPHSQALITTVSGLVRTAQTQPTVTPLTPVTNNNTTSFPYSYNNQNQMETSTENSQPAETSTAGSSYQVKGYASNLSNYTSTNMNPSTAMATSEGANNENSTYNQPSVIAETTTNYYLGGVQIQNQSSTLGQQSQAQQGSLPTRSTFPWQNVTLPLAQGQNPNPSISPTQRADLTRGIQNSNSVPFEIQKTESQTPYMSVQFQTEVANPTKSQGLNIRPIHIGRLVTHDKDGGLVISSSSTYEIGRNVFDAGSSYHGSTTLNNAGSIQNTQQQPSATNTFLNTTTNISSPTNKPNSAGTWGYFNQQNQRASPTIFVTPPKDTSPTPTSWLPTYSLLKSMKTGALASQPDQATAEASINITEILFPKDDHKGLPVMVMQSPSRENNPTVKPSPIPLIDKGISQAKMNESNLGQFQFQNVGPTQGQANGSTQILTQGQTQGSMNGPTQILNKGQTQGPTNGPTQILTQGQTHGPTMGPTQKSTQSPTQGPTKVITLKLTQGPTQGPVPTSGVSTSMFSLGSNPTVVGTVNPTAGISTVTSKLPTAESSASLLAGEEKAAGNTTYLIPSIEESGTISLPGSQTDELTAKEMENMMHVEDIEDTLFGNKDSMSNELPKNEVSPGGEKEESATPQKPIQALISEVPTADPYKGVKDALLSVDIAQLKPGELLSLRLPNSQTSDIFQVKDIKSNDDVSAYSSDLDNDHEKSLDKKHILYAIIEKVKHNKDYRNAMKAIFSTGDRRSWKSSKKSGSVVRGKLKTIALPQRAILRSYSKNQLDKKNEEKFAKLVQENIGLMNVAGSHFSKEMKNPDIEFDQVHHVVEKYVKKDSNDANKLRLKLMSVGAKMHRLQRKSSIRGSKRSGLRGHRHYNKKKSSDEKGYKKTEGTFEVTLNVSGKKKKPSEEKTKEDDKSEKTANKLKPGSKLKFMGTFTDQKKENGEEDKVKKISSLRTEQTSQGLQPNRQPGNVIIEDEKGNVLYKGPVDIAALNQTVTKNGGNDTGFQLQNVGYRVDPSANSEENVVLKQGLQQVIPKKRSRGLLHRRHRLDIHNNHLRRRYSRSIEIKKDVIATKKTDGTFKLTLAVSGKTKEAANAETNKEGKDDVNINDARHQLFHDEKELTFSGTFTDGKDSKDENGNEKKKEKENGEEHEEHKKENEEEEEEQQSKEKKKAENEQKSSEKEFSNKNGQGNTTSMSQPKVNATNVIIEDGKGNILYKGPVDIAALNKTVSTKNGTYSGFHLETAGYKIEESTDPQEVELLNDGLQHAIQPSGTGTDPQELKLLNDGLQHAIQPSGTGSPLQFLEPKRKRRSLLDDTQPSKKTDGTFTLTLALKDDKKKKKENEEQRKENKEKEDQQDKERKPNEDGYYSDFPQKNDNDNYNKETASGLEKLRNVEDGKTESEKAKTVSPHVIIEDEHGKPLYQGPVDISALNKSVASKGGSLGYELQKAGYQLIKEPNQEQPVSQSETTSSQNDVVIQEASEHPNNSPNSASVYQTKQQSDNSDTNVINISSSNGDVLSGNQDDQRVSVDVTNDDGSQDHSMSAVGNEQQLLKVLQIASNIKPSDISSNKKEQEDGTKTLFNALPTLNKEIDQKPSKSKFNPLPAFNDKEYAQQQSVSDGKIKFVQDQMDKKKYREDKAKVKSSDHKIKNQEQNGSDQRKNPVTASTSFVDTTNSKLLHIYTPKPELSSKNRNLEGNSKQNDQSAPEKIPSDEMPHDEKNSQSNKSLGSAAKAQNDVELKNKENSYNVLMTDAQNGASSIGGKILQSATVIDEHKDRNQNEGLSKENPMANTIPNDGQGDVSDSSSLNKENDPNQNGQINPKNVAFLAQNIPANVQVNEAGIKTPASQMSLIGQDINNNGKHFPKKYQVLKLTRNKLKELLASSANTANVANTVNIANKEKEQQQIPVAAAMQDNPKVDNKDEFKGPNNGMEQPITLILSGPYLDQLEPRNDSASPPTNALANDQLNSGSQARQNQVNMTQTNVKNVNAWLNNPEGKNISSMLPNEMFGNDDDKILIGGGGKTVRPAAAAEGAFKSQEAASGLNVLLKTPEVQNPAFLVQSKNTSPLKISPINRLGVEAMPTISVLSGSGQRVDCHALPAGSSLTLLRCGPNGQRIVGPTVSTISKAQVASMLNLQMNDMPPQNPVPQHRLTEPDVVQNLMGAPEIRMNDEPLSNNQREPKKQEYGYGTVTDPTLYHKMSTDIRDYLDKEIDDEKNMIQNLLVGSSSPRASLPSQNNDDTDDSLPFGFAYIPGASESSLYNTEVKNQQMYQGFPNEYINTLSNVGTSRLPHKMFRSRSRHRNTRRSQIKKANRKLGPWKRRKSSRSRKKSREHPVRHWSFGGMFPPTLPLLIRPLYPQPWLLTKRCCNDNKNNRKCSKTLSSLSKIENLPTPAPASMSVWEYLGRVLCSCPCCIECYDW